MPYTDAGKSIMLRQLARAGSHLALHNGTPSADTELARGVYSRKKTEFNDPTGGRIHLVGDVPFEVPSGANVTHGGLWTAPDGGVLLAWGEFEKASFEARGVYVVDSAIFDLNIQEG